MGQRGKVAFIYPGSSTAYTGLGRDLFQLFPQLYARYDNMGVQLDTYLWSDYLYPKRKSTSDPLPNIYENAIAMMSIGVFYSASFTHILRSVFKLEPDIAFGYSMGECSSMWYSLGVWGAGEAKEFQESPIFKNRFAGKLELLAEHWGITSEEAKERWISLVLLAPKEEVEKLVDLEKQVYLSFVNTEKEVVVSGDKKACLAIAEQLKCPTIPIPFQNVIHHDFCKAEYDGLISMHHFPLQEIPDIDFYSSISQSKLDLESQAIAENSTAVCCRQVDFPETVKTVYHAGAKIFIELGANTTCTNWIKTILKEKDQLAIAINQKGKSDIQSLMELVAQLLSHGISLDLSVLYPKVEWSHPSARFSKKIMPGGARIFDAILSEENRKRFAGIEKRKKEMVLTESGGGIFGGFEGQWQC